MLIRLGNLLFYSRLNGLVKCLAYFLCSCLEFEGLAALFILVVVPLKKIVTFLTLPKIDCKNINQTGLVFRAHTTMIFSSYFDNN